MFHAAGFFVFTIITFLFCDYPIANVQCQYDSPSDTDVEDRTVAATGPTEDHNYGVKTPVEQCVTANDEPPAFVIHQTNQMQYTNIAPKIMTIAPGYPSVNLIHVEDQAQNNGPGGMNQSQPEYNINKRIRRSEVVLRAAADCVSRGLTFQTVSEQFNIPISTIRFFMARKGILPRRRRGRSTQVVHASSSPEPPFHMQHYKLPNMLALKADEDEQHE